jgi:hypothetical protein
MSRRCLVLLAASMLAGCFNQPRPFLYPTQERDYLRAVGAVKRTIQQQPELLAYDGGALLTVAVNADPPTVRLLARGATPRVALAALIDSATTTQSCGGEANSVVLFAPSRVSRLPLTIVDCAQLQSEITQWRAAQALVSVLARDLGLAKAGLDSVSARVTSAEIMLAQSVTIDLVQQDLLTSRGAAINTLQARTVDMARSVRGLAITTKTLTDSLSKQWRTMDDRLSRLKTTLDGIK